MPTYQAPKAQGWSWVLLCVFIVKIDLEDVDDILQAVAQRTGRPLDDIDRNPMMGQIKTVGDVVHFFVAQPRAVIPTAAA